MRAHWLSLACVTLALGCSISPKPPRAQAAAVEARCEASPSATDQRIVDPRNVEGVEPLYAIVDSRPNGMESRLIGAKVHLRNVEGVTAEGVSHAIACHSARETLRGAPTTCPYSIPDRWVDIQVKADGDGYDVLLQGEDGEEARQILERARTFASN
jgi:hypothetical protein